MRLTLDLESYPACAGHLLAPRKRVDAVRQEVARGADALFRRWVEAGMPAFTDCGWEEYATLTGTDTNRNFVGSFCCPDVLHLVLQRNTIGSLQVE